MAAVFAYRSPTQRTELLSLLADCGEQARVLAGGTDLLIDMRNGVAHPEVVVNLKNVEGFSAMSWSDTEGLIIRPGVTVNDVLFDARIRERFPLLIACARDLASHQIRNRATVIGNVVNASPCSDMAPALLCLGARAVISSKDGQRVVPFTEFFTGVKRTVLRPGEILEEIIVPADGRRRPRRVLQAQADQGPRSRHRRRRCHAAERRRSGLGSARARPRRCWWRISRQTAPVDTIVAAARGAVNPISDLRCSQRVSRAHGRGLRSPSAQGGGVMKISVTVNGHLYDRDVEDHWTLLRFLRESVGLDRHQGRLRRRRVRRLHRR